MSIFLKCLSGFLFFQPLFSFLLGFFVDFFLAFFMDFLLSFLLGFFPNYFKIFIYLLFSFIPIRKRINIISNQKFFNYFSINII